MKTPSAEMPATLPRPAEWVFVVERRRDLSVRREPFLSGRVERGSVQAGDWFQCPAGILGQVVSIDAGRVLAEPEQQLVLVANREGLYQGDVLTSCAGPQLASGSPRQE